MAKLRIILLIAVLVSWWQKDTLEDRSLTQEGIFASSAQTSARIWGLITPGSPAKNWIRIRDQWLDDIFNPQQDYSHPSVSLDTTLPERENNTDVEVPSQLLLPPSPQKEDTHPNAVDSHGKHANNPSAVTIENSPPNVVEDKKEPLRRILIAGDSMSGDVGLSLRQLAFKHKQKTGVDIQIIDAHRHSTGLVVPSYYNWKEELPALLTKNQPQGMVFMVGANDGQSMRLEDKTWVLPGSDSWALEYERRAKQVVDTTPATTQLIWLDLPPVRLKSLQEKTLQVNPAIHKALATCKHCLHLETRSDFGGDNYVENSPGKSLRSKDGIHYSRSGASLVAKKIWTAFQLPLYD